MEVASADDNYLTFGATTAVDNCETRFAGATREIVGFQPVVIRNTNKGQRFVFVFDETAQRVWPAAEAYSDVAIIALDTAMHHLQAHETAFLIGRGVTCSSFIDNPFEGAEVGPWMASMAGIAEVEVAVETAEVTLVVWYTWTFTRSASLVL